jgi:hypothetical protein
MIIVYNLYGQEYEVATKLRPLQLQEEIRRLTGSGQAAQKLRNAGEHPMLRPVADPSTIEFLEAVS